MEKWKRQFIRFLFPYSASRTQIHAAYIVKHPHVPQLLYKFRQFSDLHKGALQNNKLWLASAEKFNDPYDTGVYFDAGRFIVEDQSAQDYIALAKEMLAAQESGTTWLPKPVPNPIEQGPWIEKTARGLLQSAPIEVREGLLKAIKSHLEKQAENSVRAMSDAFRKGYGVLCFAENATSVLMWSHYANNHKGFCIEYDFGKLDPSDLRRRLCYPVFYRKKFTDATRYLSKLNIAEYNNLFGVFMSLIKSDEWAYEEEWRIVSPIGPSAVNCEFDMPVPSSIILGAHVEPDDEAWMRSYCRNNGVELKRIVKRHNEFRLDICSAT